MKCYLCGCGLNEDNYREASDQKLCHDCYDEHAYTCSECEGSFLLQDTVRDDSITTCRACFDEYYTSCNNCDCIVYRNDANYDSYDDPYCSDCYDGDDDCVIRKYDYSPKPIFFGNDTRYMGIEIEVDKGGTSESKARKIIDSALDDTIYIKHDGSLSNGLEIVSHPMTLGYHVQDMNWADVLDKSLELDYYSHNTSTCGLHVHVNRESLGVTPKEQDITISKILYFVERHWDKLLLFSRRTTDQLDRWARRYGLEDHPHELLVKAKNQNHGRYTCINLQNYNTIEFRIFRGTLKLNTLIATLQLVNKICDVAISLSENELTKLSWNEFIEDITDKELITYLKERKLYTMEDN